MLKFIKSNPIAIIIMSIFVALIIGSCSPQPANAVAPVMVRPMIVSPAPKPPVQAKPVQTVKPTVPVVAVLSPQIIKTVCTEKNKLKKDCTRK